MGAEELIELVEADPHLFHGATAPPHEAPPRRTRRQVVTACAAAVGVAGLLGAGVAVLVWQPWREDIPSLWLPAVGEPATLTDQLVIDRWNAPAGVTTYQAVTSSLVGYRFATPPGSARAATLSAAAAPTSLPLAAGGATELVRDAPTVLNVDADGGILLSFGPIDGWVYHLDSTGLHEREVRAVADVVRIDERGVLVGDSRTLQDLEPVSSFAAEAVAASIVLPRYAVGGTRLSYGGRFLVDLYSAPAPDGTVLAAAAAFFAGLGSTAATTVHGLPAVHVQLESGRLHGLDVVAWVEGGRLVALQVQRNRGLDAVELAERVRPATDEEWAELRG